MASTQQYSINLGLSDTPETTNPELFGEASKIYNAIKNLASALDAYTGALQQDKELWSLLTPADTIHSQGMNRLYVPFFEDVALGQVITLYDNAGILTAKKAGGPAWAGDTRAYCSTVGGVLAGDYGECILFGLHPYVSGATPGALYYTSNITAGSIGVKPVANANKLQPIGFALSSTSIFFCPSILVPIIDTSSLAITVLTP